MSMNVPFEKNEQLSGHSIEALRIWLEKNGKKNAYIGGNYLVCDLIKNLIAIENGMWNDGIDARGEDA